MLLKDLKLLDVARITIIFTQFADLYNVNKSYGFSRYIKSKNQKCYIEVHFIHQRRHPDGVFMGDRAARIGGCGFPVPRARPWGR
jgi:hypothetical protein